jgi:hypothetical protein
MVETRKKRGGFCFRNKKNYSGGGLGQGYSPMGEMLSRGNPALETYSSCGAASRPGVLTSAEISGMKGGLPGLAGGSRKGKGGKGGKGRKARKGKGSRKHRRSTRKVNRQSGGRYETVFSGVEYEALGPRGGMLATAGRLACETGIPPHVSPTQSTAPAVAMSGGAQLAPAPFLQEATAGYSQSPSSFLDSVGAPILLNNPAGGRMGVPACAQTGGGYISVDDPDKRYITNFMKQFGEGIALPPQLDKYTKERIATIIDKYKDSNEETKDFVGSLTVYPVVTQLNEATQQIIKAKYTKKPQMSMIENSQFPPPATRVPNSASPPPGVLANNGDENDKIITELLGAELKEKGSMPPPTESKGGRRRKHRKNRKTQRKHRKSSRKH